MRLSDLTRTAATGVLALSAVLAVQSPASARTTSASRSFSTPRGTFNQTETTSVSVTKGVVSRTVTTIGPMGAVATAHSITVPDGHGGRIVSRTFTGFSGKTGSSSKQYGP